MLSAAAIAGAPDLHIVSRRGHENDNPERNSRASRATAAIRRLHYIADRSAATMSSMAIRKR